MNSTETKCQFCGQSAYGLLLRAMLQDLGCSVGDVNICIAREEGLPHDFSEPDINSSNTAQANA